MNNEQIIAKLAIENGLLTAEEAENRLSKKEEIALHTAKGWFRRGYKIKNGEQGIEAYLWRKRGGMEKVNNKQQFYKAKAYLYTEKQVEPR